MKLQFLSPAIIDVSFTLDEIEERDIEVAARPGQDNISVWTCTRFVYGKQEEMPARVVVPSGCHRARGTASLCGVCYRKILPKMTRCLSLLYFSHVEKFSYSSKMHPIS